MKTSDLLDLVRIPNVFTAMSDIVAAAAVAGMVRADAIAWIPAGLALGTSATFYLAGMALNDVADSERDARERPGRPIPSGRVSRFEAGLIAGGLVLVGLVLAGFAGAPTLLVAALLLASIVAYDLALAGRPLAGPVGMASCRGLNVLLGLTAAGGLGPTGLAMIAIWMVYVFGLTHLSLGEVEGSPRLPVAVSLATLLLAGLGVLALARIAVPARGLVSWILVTASLAAYAARSVWLLAQAWIQPRPARIGRAVGGQVSGILWLGASMSVAVAAGWWLLPFLGLAGAQEFLRRRFRVT